MFLHMKRIIVYRFILHVRQVVCNGLQFSHALVTQCSILMYSRDVLASSAERRVMLVQIRATRLRCSCNCLNLAIQPLEVRFGRGCCFHSTISDGIVRIMLISHSIVLFILTAVLEVVRDIVVVAL